MIYRTIGIMSGSSLDGLDIVFAELHENAGSWNYEIVAAECYPYPATWITRLKDATSMNANEYMLLHSDYGHYIGQQVNRFIEANELQYKAGLISSHGHTTFHAPERMMTAQLGDGAAIAAETKLPVVTDLRAMDLAFGGQGAPIVPIGEKLLLKDYDMYLNLGGIANISFRLNDRYIAFDICAANRVLNMIASTVNKEYDAGGQMAASGNVDHSLLEKLNSFPYYGQVYPKSLANSFGIEEVYPLVKSFGLTHSDQLRTYVEHIVTQIGKSVQQVMAAESMDHNRPYRLLATGGGAFNTFLMQQLSDRLKKFNISVEAGDDNLVQYKEALIMALIGVLRWRMEYNILSTVTGAERDSIGGAVWIGQEA
jgi:anhydro-N-acetylmuramic acid kinase